MPLLATSRSVPRCRSKICWGSANIPTGLDCDWLCWTGPLALMGRMCSGPRVEATPLAYAKVPPLAHTAVSGLIFDGALFFGQPQASPPIPLWLERRSPHIPLGDLRSLLS